MAGEGFCKLEQTITSMDLRKKHIAKGNEYATMGKTTTSNKQEKRQENQTKHNTSSKRKKRGFTKKQWTARKSHSHKHRKAREITKKQGKARQAKAKQQKAKTKQQNQNRKIKTTPPYSNSLVHSKNVFPRQTMHLAMWAKRWPSWHNIGKASCCVWAAHSELVKSKLRKASCANILAMQASYFDSSNKQIRLWENVVEVYKQWEKPWQKPVQEKELKNKSKAVLWSRVRTRGIGQLLKLRGGHWSSPTQAKSWLRDLESCLPGLDAFVLHERRSKPLTSGKGHQKGVSFFVADPIAFEGLRWFGNQHSQHEGKYSCAPTVAASSFYWHVTQSVLWLYVPCYWGPCVEHMWTSGRVGQKMLKYGSEWYRLPCRKFR